MAVPPDNPRGTMKILTPILCLAALVAVGCTKQSAANEYDSVLPGRHMSEHQVVDIAGRALPVGLPFRCEFTNGVWETLEIQKEKGADGKAIIRPNSATRVVLRIRDIDGTIEHVKTP